MADCEKEVWFVGEDGCLSVGDAVQSVTYHPTLNALLVCTKEPRIRVIDVTSGAHLQSSDLSAGSDSTPIQCLHMPSRDKTVFCGCHAVSCRKDSSGVLLLDTALQTAVKQAEDQVCVELMLPDANHLFKCLMSAELAGVDYVEDVLRELETEIEAVQNATKYNHKVAKWATVKIKLPHFALKTVCSTLMTELRRLHQNVPGLSVAAAINDRLNYLLPSSTTDTLGGQVDRSLMYSEAARWDTFAKWPHMNYKWALPDPMAQAGFYHQPSSTGDDRAMCFTCNVCLICWEPTDEPWSEHERHSPQCPFVKGEYTQNVPMSATFATEPAQPHGSETDQIVCLSSSSSDEYFATSTLQGNVVIWSINRQMEKHIQFNIDPWEPVVTSRTGSQTCVYSDTKAKPSILGCTSSNPLADSLAEPISEPSTSQEKSSNETDCKKSVVLCDSKSVQTRVESGTLEVIEVSGAWKKEPVPPVVEVSLHNNQCVEEPFQRCRPSQDVQVSALCMLGSPNAAVAAATEDASCSTARPCLVSGVGIRRNVLSINDIVITSMGSSGCSSLEEEGSEVQALNQVNQAKSNEDVPEIISEGVTEKKVELSGNGNPFVPFLLIHDIKSTKSGCIGSNDLKEKISKPKKSSSSGTGGGSKQENQMGLSNMISKSLAQELQDHFIDLDDSDVQIVGVEGEEEPLVLSKVALPSASVGLSESGNSIVQSQSVSSEQSQLMCTQEGVIGPLAKYTTMKEGCIVQCIALPKPVDHTHHIKSMFPTPDGKHLVVITAPNQNEDLDADTMSHDNIDITSTPVKDSGCDAAADVDTSVCDAPSAEPCPPGVGGCVVVYRVCEDQGMVCLDCAPCRVHVLDQLGDAIVSALMLPLEVNHTEEDGAASNSDGTSPWSQPDVEGCLVIVTRAGHAQVLKLNDFRLLADIGPPEADPFISAAYCTGIDRLCCCTTEGKLHFYMLGPRNSLLDDGTLEDVTDGTSLNKVPSVTGEDAMDTTLGDQPTKSDLLAMQPLDLEVLTALYELTQFENLVPRFSATLPPCWNEIQQEQQQRRHPQHLQHHGEATQHTRTWKLQPDSSSWDEHMFELVLPKPSSLGHIDIKFSLHPLCTTAPSIQITLLKQIGSTLGRAGTTMAPVPPAQVDDKIEFNMTLGNANDVIDLGCISEVLSSSQSDEAKSATVSSSSSSATLTAGSAAAAAADKMHVKVVNPVTSQLFLEHHKAEIVCGPVDLAQYVDLSGHNGVVTLSSPQLLKVRSRALLLHVKAMVAPNKQTQDKAKQQEKSSSVHRPSTSSKEKKPSLCKLAADQFPYMPGTADKHAGGRKIESLWGCDLLQEISVTVRKCRRTSIPRDRVQRNAMVELLSFHEQLMVTACGSQASSTPSESLEHQQKLALDILTWIAALQINSVGKNDTSMVALTVQSNLPALVRACLLDAPRAVAHQCARLLSFFTMHTKVISSVVPSPSFSVSLLHALLDCLPHIPSATSAGALHWYFTLLNRVKCMDANLTSQKCAEMLSAAAAEYDERQNPLHALLQTRFGLYGRPLEPELFDVEPPYLAQRVADMGTSSENSYAGIVGASAATAGATAATPLFPEESLDLSDFVHIAMLDRGAASGVPSSSSLSKGGSEQAAHHSFGLLEVEPLHFACHATSDGTRLERIDAGQPHSTTNGPSGLSGTINFTEPGQGALSSAAGVALASLSNAMASAEQQLQQLQQKQIQLLKLQQQKQKLEMKLAETSTKGGGPFNHSGSAGSAYSAYNSELFPPTPKNTPFFMTPPVTPPNESYHNIFIGPGDPSKPPTGKESKAGGKADGSSQKLALYWPQSHNLFQPPPPQALVIERMHSGARRFVVLDFGAPILLTDVLVPASSDLASLSIDIWVSGEDVDGQRLVVSPDIGTRSLIMNNLMPPPLCRYLKITTIGRYGASTTRSKIPLGSFYGHTFILPWEAQIAQQALCPSEGTHSQKSEPTLYPQAEQSQLLSQVSVYLSLLEDIQCRYSLACNRLTSLLAAIDAPHNPIAHTQYFLRKSRKAEEDAKTLQAYHDCMSLQLQLNLAHRAIQRLQRALGIRSLHSPSGMGRTPGSGPTPMALLKDACTDKLRYLTEQLLATLLGMTNPSPSIPQVPITFHMTFDPQMCESLFRNICIMGTRKMQIQTGVLLVRVCGSQDWWGDFLGNLIQEFFSSDHSSVFPRDRVFLVLTALGQRALHGPNASRVLESMLSLLARLLLPLLSTHHHHHGVASIMMLDMSMISWLLLFLSKCLDCATTNWAEDNDKASKDKENGSMPNRWDFLHGETALQSRKQSSRSLASRLYRKRLQKRLMHHKQQLLSIQQSKKSYLSAGQAAAEKMWTGSKGGFQDMMALIEGSEMDFKKQFKQYSSKHFKDIMNIRKTDGELLRKLSKEGASSSGGGADRDGGTESDLDSVVTVTRERCIPVIRGLVSLLLSMDFTCNADLFIVTCKVLARIAGLARPSIQLSEVMSPEELEQVLLLMCSAEYNHGNISWGTVWASHTITCLLQDILDGEKLGGTTAEGSVDEDISASCVTETDDSLPNSGTLPTMDESVQDSTTLPTVDEDCMTSDETDVAASAAKDSNANTGYKLDKEGSLILDMLLEEDDDIPAMSSLDNINYMTLDNAGGAADVPSTSLVGVPVSGGVGTGTKNYSAMFGLSNSMGKYAPVSSALSNLTSMSNGLGLEAVKWTMPGPTWQGGPGAGGSTLHQSKISDILEAGGLSLMTSSSAVLPGGGTNNDKSSKHMKWWKDKLATYFVQRSPSAPQGISTAIDSRLENSLELTAELKLKVMLTMEMETIQNALTAVLPPLPPMLPGCPIHSLSTSHSLTDEEQLSGNSFFIANQGMNSVEMLSGCFTRLFQQLPQHTINLDSLLAAWLTLNDEPGCNEDAMQPVFDSSRVPSIPLNPAAVTTLLATLAWSPHMPVRTWVLALQTLTLLANLKVPTQETASHNDGGEQWLAAVIVADPNLMNVFVKFLSGTNSNGSVATNQNAMQIGPTATKVFHEFLVRLQVKCAESSENHLKELLLKLVYTLTSDRGAFSLGLGPLDVQCKLLDLMLEQSYESVDISNALSVVQAVSCLVHQHLFSQERTACRSSTESTVSARSCFGGILASVLRSEVAKSTSNQTSRDMLMGSLLKLVGLLVQIPLPGHHRSAQPPHPPTATPGASVSVLGGAETHTADNLDSPMTDLSKMSLGQTGHIVTSTPNIPLETSQSDEEKGSQLKPTVLLRAMTGQEQHASSTVDSSLLEPERRDAALCDVVLRHQHVMSNLLQALSCCNSSTMAMLISSSGLNAKLQDSFNNTDPVSVGDGVFHLMWILNKCTTDLTLVMRPVYEYLVGRGGLGGSGLSRLSEPLLWFILRVLSNTQAINIFLEMGGIQAVCENLVRTNRQVINTSPSLVSTIMQYLASSRTSSSSSKKGSSSSSENADGLQNFAPLGAISSSSPTACPAEVLIQAAPPHRRARSAAWSYHFYPDEVWVDLTIALPCAVLLREVQIQPHLASLATCPSAVTLEVSRDGSTMTPICSPVSTSGLTCIKITLLRPEVVSVVTLRLHKPRDSSTIGLSQLMLMGTTVFSDVAAFKASSITAPMEDYVSLTSIGWLRLLHHCLTVSSEAQEAVARAAAPTPDLLLTCTSLLGSSSAVLYANSIEAVMLKVGLHSQQMGLSLLHLLLRNSLLATDNNVRLHNRRGCYANESTVDILYQLGIHQDEDTCSRLRVLIEWLGDSAQIALDRSRSQKPMSSAHRAGHSGQHQLVVDATCPAQAHVHCVAAVLWFSHDSTVHYDLKQIVTQDLLSLMYEWSMVLPAESILKQSVDAVVCAMCYIQPQYFSLLLQWMGVHLPPTDLSSASVSDDHKETGVSVNSVAASLTQEMLTDDLKADEARNRLEATLSIPQAMGLATPHLSNSDPYMVLPQLLTEEQLTTLAVASQSPVALAQMLDSGLLGQLCQGLFEFCMNQLSHLGEFHHLINTDGMTDNGKANSDPTSPRPPYSPGGTSSRSHSTSGPQGHDCSASVDLVAPTLRFLAEVAQEVEVKVWLGGDQASVFWPVLLRLLCATPRQLVSPDLVHAGSTKTMTSHHRSLIETATIDFFSSIISCHPENQLQFATVLCDVIGGKGSENGLSSCPLSGFMRRLFLQVLLEDEKVLVCFKSPSQLYKGPSNALSSSIQHPRFGAGHKYRTIWASLQSSCGDVLSRVSDTANTLSQLSTVEKEKKGEAEWPKDVSELGIEVVDQLSAAAGLQAKEKRAKSKAPFSPRHPPRPPSRRGHRPPDKIAGGIIPVLSIYHKMLPDQPIPHGISLSQLLVLLRQRGFPVGQGWLELNMTLEPKSTPCEKAESRPKPESEIGGQEATTSDGPEPSVERIPDEVLLDTSTMPSALQVFASVGGLALLAEHLPLLYPEITRQAVPTEASKETNTGATSTGQDWVTVESIEDMYEEAYEAIPATHPPVGTKPALAPLPTIPPHSLVSFGLFLRLPGYAEVLLQEKKKAQCLLRLVLGVTDDGDGGHILLSPTAGALPTLPFHVLELLFDATPLSTDDGVLLRRMTLDIGAVHLVLACLSVLSHHAPRQPIPGFHQEIILAATHASSTVSSTAASASTTTGAASTANPSTSAAPKSMADDKGQLYWAKGTGFGTGSTASSWDAEQALLRQKSEEEHVTCLLQVLATYIHPGGCIPPEEDLAERSEEEGSNSNLPSSLQDLLSQSCLVPSISSYLRNDSVLDMARHVPLYRALLKLLRGLAVCQTLVPLLLPLEKDEDSTVSISSLLDKMKSCVDTYASRLKTNKKGKNRQEDEESEGLALLIPDIQETARIVEKSIHCVRHKSENGDDSVEMEEVPQAAVRLDRSLSYTYMSCMRALQFDTYEMVVEEDGKLEFTVPHHYEGNVRSAGDINNAARARRLAQEAVTLSTSLPLSYSSSVFVRCDEERLDVMKVLITGPEETPYANGCFEFDVYFPADYPNSPPLINLETTGNHTVRFNPNLYNDGKVCLSILNTWHGRPEEKWNAQTSSFLQVLVSIQSLILVNEPYFNEPGYERSHGTPSGTASSREYDANIRQASVKWGMLEVLRNTPACFRDAVDRHFWMKKEEIMHQIEAWVIDMEMNSSDKRVGRTISHSCVALKRHYAQLKEEFAKMKAPSDLSDEIPESNDPELGSSYSTAAPSRPPPESPLDPAALPLGSDLANHMAASTESEETDTATTTDSNQDTSMHDPDPDEYIL